MSSNVRVEAETKPWVTLPAKEKAALLDVLEAADFDISVVRAVTRYAEVREQARKQNLRKRYTDLKSDHRTRWTAGGRYPAEIVFKWQEAAKISGRSMKKFMEDAAQNEYRRVMEKPPF